MTLSPQEELLHLLHSGADDRTAPDILLRNRYGRAAFDDGLIRFGSCTSSTPSEAQWRFCVDRLVELRDRTLRGESLQSIEHEVYERIRARLRAPVRRQIVSQRRMQLLQPELKELQKKYKGERGKLLEVQQQFYRERGVSPTSGCLPMVLQFGLLIPMYTVISQGLTNFNPQAMSIFGPSLTTEGAAETLCETFTREHARRSADGLELLISLNSHHPRYVQLALPSLFEASRTVVGSLLGDVA